MLIVTNPRREISREKNNIENFAIILSYDKFMLRI